VAFPAPPHWQRLPIANIQLASANDCCCFGGKSDRQSKSAPAAPDAKNR
jgi:hypothetical protein